MPESTPERLAADILIAAISSNQLQIHNAEASKKQAQNIAEAYETILAAASKNP